MHPSQRYAKIKDHPNLVKDTKTNAVLNTDLAAVRRHHERYAKVAKELTREQDIQQLKDDVNSLKGSIERILELLTKRD